jgi:rhodanese-related sulfurtransferase
VDLIPAREVRRLQQAGQAVTVVDVRSQPEYLGRHITGAVSLPLKEIEERAREIPRVGLVVLY